MKITGYRSLTHRARLGAADRRRQRSACRGPRTDVPVADPRDRRRHRGRRPRRPRRHRPGLPRRRGRGPASGRRRSTTGCSTRSSRPATRAPRSARSARSTWRCGTSRPSSPASRCGAPLGARDRFVPGYASGLDIAPRRRRARRPLRARSPTAGSAPASSRAAGTWTATCRRLGIMRDVLGRNSRRPALMLDANESWNRSQAVRYVAGARGATST